MRTIAVAMGLLLAAQLLQTGCASARRGAPFDRDVAIDSPQLALGQQAFMTHCHSCHPGGEAGLGPALNNKPLPAALIKFQVRHGLGAMPAFDEQHLSEEELNALAAYLIALREAR
ncbi:MAG: c-type cytochrome [Candidatus Sericytochromatia bacterium]